MRAIKFRGWHRIESKMCDVDVLTNDGAFLVGITRGLDDISSDGKLIVIAPEDGRFCTHEEFVLMQFTGLKDRNDKPIFEGDILSGVKDSSTMKDIKHVVEYIHGGFDIPMWVEGYKIIGNIHENPELLKEGK